MVALVLASVVLGLVAQSVSAHRRGERTISGSSRSAAIVDETIGVLTSILERVSSTDTILLRGDTAIEVGLPIGLGIACAAGGDSVVLRDTGTGWWESPPDSGDVVETMILGQWWRGQVVSARVRTAASGACAGLQRVLRIWPLPPSSLEPPLVRVTRRARFMTYRGSDGEWWFGERICGASPPHACTAAQPVSGPVGSARALHFAIDSTGAGVSVIVAATVGSAVRTAVLSVRP
jgi:hypothetical protein